MSSCVEVSPVRPDTSGKCRRTPEELREIHDWVDRVMKPHFRELEETEKKLKKPDPSTFKRPMSY